MNRRTFLSKATITTAATAATTLTGAAVRPKKSSPVAPRQTERPNILVVMTDQQSADMLSILGNPHLHTPAMDSIAKRGVSYHKAYVTNPICVPSRASFMTGTMPHENNVNFNMENHAHNITAEPLGNYVKQAGYRTGYIGKWHIPHSPQDKEWHGFDTVELARDNEIDPYMPEACARFLNTPSDDPFLLFASFLNPHDICEVARMIDGTKDRFKNGEIPGFPDVEHCPELPENFAIPEDEPSVIRTNKAHPKNKRTYPSIGWTEEQWRKYRWAYARLTELVDHQIGKLLELLKVSGHEDNTVIIFTSDHGDGNASHQWNQKTLFYDESARVPFIVMDPRVEGGEQHDHEHLVSFGLDLFPTIFDYAGVEQPAHLQGCSARPDRSSGALDARDHVVSENDLTFQYGYSGGVYGRMIRTDRYKYVCYSEGTSHEQLFDMDTDPGEMKNLVADPAHETDLEHCRQLLRDYITRTDDFFPIEQVG